VLGYQQQLQQVAAVALHPLLEPVPPQQMVLGLHVQQQARPQQLEAAAVVLQVLVVWPARYRPLLGMVPLAHPHLQQQPQQQQQVQPPSSL
jgi:hypothetical protein